MQKCKTNFSVGISFEALTLPPFQDILILGKKCPHGKQGTSKCFNLLSPDDFELVELDDEIVEAMLINKRILKRMPAEKIIEILKQKVFPFISSGETVKVDFKVKIWYDSFEGKLES